MLPIHPTAQSQGVGIDLIGRDEPRSNRCGAGSRFALAPLPTRGVDLPGSLREVIGDRLAGNVSCRASIELSSCVVLPITTPTSTSQSVWKLPGNADGLVGADYLFGGFLNITGLYGGADPDQAACAA